MVLATPHFVRKWHNPDMTTSLLYVRYRVMSGKHLLPASISAFDPERTSRCFGLGAKFKPFGA
jgi:hypothetical protein